MKEKLKELFDSRTTWATLGVVAGAFGTKAGAVVNALGVFVMAIL